MKTISSLDNPLFKKTLKLQDRKERDATGLFGLEGLREIQRAWDSQYELETFFVCKTFMNQEAESLLSQFNSRLGFELDEKCFNRLVVRKDADGIYAVFKQKKWSFSELKLSKNPFLLLIDGIEKPGNIGALLRCTDAVGVDAVIVNGVAPDLYNPNLIRASVGAVFSQAVVYATREASFEFFAQHKINTFGAALSDKSYAYAKADFSKPTAILLGSEDKGLDGFWQKHCQDFVKIPMLGIADSLNVAVAGGILMYQVLLKRGSF